MQTTNLNLKHLTKRLTNEQDTQIRQLAFNRGISYVQAKELFFEGTLEKWLK